MGNQLKELKRIIKNGSRHDTIFREETEMFSYTYEEMPNLIHVLQIEMIEQ